VSGAAMAFRREVWAAAGPLSERYLFYCQDIDLCLHALEKGWTVRILPEARVRHALGRTIAGENALSYDPERLWSDLLTWGREHYGRRWSRFARWALLSAAALRIGTRTLRPPFGRDATTRAFRRGWRRLAQADS
jgi:GT2 family glycosyltransferase